MPLLMCVVLSGCGFHLQGATSMSPVMKVTYVDTEDARSSFLLTLMRSLKASGATLTPDRDLATAVLHIEHDETGQRVLSVSAANKPTEYEIFYKVKYSVSAGGKEILATQTLELTRDYSFDETTLLAKVHEEDILREALARDLAGIVMSRLASL
ncbi:MAG TPA: LPS assembly lipoprotein LptE [Steroidobacteraceae bacterium]|nr:LPS assembly lipoprotein LptE [Steroidobacteraceae bacterium]